MTLIIGGAHAGKQDWAKAQLGYSDWDFTRDPGDALPVFYGLQDFLRDNASTPELLQQLLRKQVVICDEVGCGVVPLDPADRAWREKVGRLCIALAAEAEQVVRVFCGIGQVIK